MRRIWWAAVFCGAVGVLVGACGGSEAATTTTSTTSTTTTTTLPRSTPIDLAVGFDDPVVLYGDDFEVTVTGRVSNDGDDLDVGFGLEDRTANITDELADTRDFFHVELSVLNLTDEELAYPSDSDGGAVKCVTPDETYFAPFWCIFGEICLEGSGVMVDPGPGEETIIDAVFIADISNTECVLTLLPDDE